MIYISLDEPNGFMKKVVDTYKMDEVVGYKVGIGPALRRGLASTVSAIKGYTDKIIIYDHQKAGNDIPDMGRVFAEECLYAQVDAAILFPFTGLGTLFTWVSALHDVGVKPIVGGYMTHETFADILDEDKLPSVYRKARVLGTDHFVIPGTRCDIAEHLPDFMKKATLYAPGFGAQGGDAKAMRLALGRPFHAIIGRSATADFIKKTWEDIYG